MDVEYGPGWSALIARDYAIARRADVFNRGFSGYNSRYVVDDLRKGLLSLPPPESMLAVVLMLGTNDQSDQQMGQGVPLAEYRANMRAIVEMLRSAAPKAKVIMMAPPPCDAKVFDRLMGIPGCRDQSRVLAYVEVVRSLAAELGCTCVDLNACMLEAEKNDWSERFLWDGIHFSATGNKFVYDAVSKALDDAGLAPSALSWHRPHFLARTWPTKFTHDGALIG